MKAVVSTTYDDKYLFFLPIITWCWNKLGVDVVCFAPLSVKENNAFLKMALLEKIRERAGLLFSFYGFSCQPHKESTYAQCSRLYASAMMVADDELLFTSDIDMCVFKVPPFNADIYIYGADLVPDKQFPICYAAGRAITWRALMAINGRSFQKCLDDLLGGIECENMRGNYWGKDQETLFDKVSGHAHKVPRARPGTQFAMNRVDRDDINWRSYLGPDLIDAHLWRPGYIEENFANILELLQTQYPEDNFQWMIDYRNEYIKLI